MASMDNIDNSQTVHPGGWLFNNVNNPLPWCVLASILSSLALGVVVSDHARIGDSIEHQNTLIRINNETQLTLIHNAENRAIDGQNMGLIAEQKCNSLEIEMARHNIVLQPTVKK